MTRFKTLSRRTYLVVRGDGGKSGVARSATSGLVWLLFKAVLSSLEVAVAAVPCFNCKMVAVHFWLCFPDFITVLLRSAGFQSFGIASVVQGKLGLWFCIPVILLFDIGRCGLERFVNASCRAGS